MPSLATHVEEHSAPAAARETVRRLLPEGIPPTALQRLRGRPAHDVRDRPVGGFVSMIAPHAPVGTSAGARECGAGGVGHVSDRRMTMVLTTRKPHLPPLVAYQREEVGRQLQAVRTAPSRASR